MRKNYLTSEQQSKHRVEIKNYLELKTKILEHIKDSPKTVQDLCRDLRHIDDLEIASALLELNMEKKVALKGYKTVYREDGDGIDMGLYVAVSSK